ncbi:MAG TPA: TlpA disulfide reductase family protein [Flavobacteriales bacterium]|jgi:peroxiredoxin|nr:TlpA disulfide reductase family protein [Flavobacteriales bacterium]
MKHMAHFLAPALLIAALGCATGGGRTVTAHIEGGGGRTLYFDRFQGNRPVHVDSVKLDAKGDGQLNVPTLPLDFYALTLGTKDMLVLVLDSTEQVKVTAKVDSLQDPISVEGSAQTDLLYAFFKETQAFDRKRQALIARLNMDRTDSAAMAGLNQINGEVYAASKRFAEANKGAPAVLSAMRNLNIQQDLALYTEVCDALGKSIPRSEYFIGFRDQVGRAKQQLDAMKAQEEQQARLDQLIPVGSPAPDFDQTTPDGRSMHLSDLKGKVVLVDFWASWCRPCRMEMPNVKKVYAQYHSKGFEILGVSLDREKEAWTNAIQQDGLPWVHVSDLQFWNNAAAQQYGVNSIPYTVLVGRDGNVIAKNLRGAQLEEKLAEVFK